MSIHLRLLLFTIIVLCFAPLAQAQEDVRLSATCVRVLDGDTIDVVSHEKNELFRVRFWGIDAPESRQDYGEDATRFLAHKILGKTVHVQVRSSDMYGRLIGAVYYGDECINITLLEVGCAWYYERYAPFDIQLSEAQRKAKESKRGLWSAETPQAPWSYRKSNRKDTSNYAISPLIAAAASGHAEVVEYLIKSGADANGIVGKLALFAAIREGHEDVVSLLLASGVDVYTKNDAYRQQCETTSLSSDEFLGKCIRVADGDSIHVLTDEGKYRKVHLYGIDAPELTQKHGLAAQSFLLKSVHGKQLEVSPVGKDSNGDIIANVYKDGEHINRTMVASGWAWSEEKSQKEKTVLALEVNKAKQAKIGIWNEKDKPVIAPWKYRKSRKLVNDTGKIAISLAASSGKIKIAEQLLSHGVRVDDEVGSVALKYAQDAKAEDLSRLLVEKGAQVIPAAPGSSRGVREVAASEMYSPTATDYRKSFSLIRNHFHEIDDSDEKYTAERKNQGIVKSRYQDSREVSVDADEADLIKAAGEGDLQKVKTLVESGVDPTATYSRYRILTEKSAAPDTFKERDITANKQSEPQFYSASVKEQIDNRGTTDIKRTENESAYKATKRPHLHEHTDRQPKLDFLTEDYIKEKNLLTSPINYENQRRGESNPSYDDARKNRYEPKTESSSSKRRRYSGHRSSSGSRSKGNDSTDKIFGFIILGGLGLLIIILWIASVDWYKIAIRKRSLFLTKLFYGFGFKLEGRALCYAALYGDSEITRFLISKGTTIVPGASGPLQIALKEKHYEVAKILLKHGANAQSALCKAIEQGNQEIIYFICSIVPEVVSDNSHNLTSEAIQSNNYNSVACLLKFGAVVDDSILSQAIQNRCGSLIIKEIINNGVKPTADNLLSSIYYGAMEAFMELLDCGIKSDSSIETNPLFQAIRYGRSTMVKALLERGFDLPQIEKSHNTIIDKLLKRWRYVDHKRFAECIALLKGRGIIERRIYYFIERLLGLNGSSDTLSVLLPCVENLDYVNRKGQSLLDISLIQSNMECFDVLVDAGAKLELRNELYQTVLMRACYRSISDVGILHLIEKGADVNACDNTGMTPFLFACMHYSCNMVERFIQYGAKLDNYDMYKNTALIYASRRKINVSRQWENTGYLIAGLLIKNGADVNAANGEGKTALHIATENQNEKLVQLLIASGADVNKANGKGKTALHIATENQNEKLVQLLIERGADVNARNRTGMTPFLFACMHSSYNMVMQLLQYGAQLDSHDMYKNTPLMYASRREINGSRQWENTGYLIAGLLIKSGADVNAANGEGKTALHIATENQNEKLVQLLIERGADVNARNRTGMTPFLFACMHSSYNMIMQLLQYGAQLDSHDMYKNTPLIYVSRGSISVERGWGKDGCLIVEELIKRGADVNEANVEGKTALHIAAENQNEKLLQLLIERGADVNAANCEGKTALHIAAENQNEKLLQLLIQRGADINALDNNGKTPILITGDKGNRKLLRLLIENGASIHDLLYNCPHLLLSSIMCMDSRFATLLIKNGANVNSVDSEGKTCLEHAIMLRMTDVCLQLIVHGADVLARRRGSTTLLYKAHKNGLELVASKIREKGGRMYAHQQECQPINNSQQFFTW